MDEAESSLNSFKTGKLKEYIENESFEEYLLQVDFYFEANGIKSDNQKRAILLTSIGKKVFSTARNLLQPRNLKEIPYPEIIEALKNYYAPATSVIMERFRFHNAKQGSEDISTFIVRIKELASKCSFGTFLNDALRDKLVCGLSDSQIQNKLLSEKDLTFTKACEISLAFETACKEAKTLKNVDSHNVFKINNVNARNTPRKDFVNKKNTFNKSKARFAKNDYSNKNFQNAKKCKHCGKNHLNECIFKNATCYRCKNRGHIATICKNNVTNFVKESDVEDDIAKLDNAYNDLQLNNFSNASKDLPKPYHITVKIGNTPVKMQIDSGSANSIISSENFKKLGLSTLKSDVKPTLRTYSGDMLEITGNYTVPVEFKGRKYSLPLIVAQASDKPTLMGRLWIEHLKVKIDEYKNNDNDDNENVNYSNLKSLRIEYSDNASIIEYYKNKYPKCFNLQDNIGILGEPVNIVMKENTVPVFCKYRPIPYAIRNLVDKEINTLISSGTLQKVTHSKWATPIVAVPKINPDGTKTVRICGDFSVTVNKYCETQFYPLPSQEEILNNLGAGKFFTKIDLSKAFHQIPIACESQELLTLNTPQGLLRYTRLPFGIKSASFLFQQKMDNILKEFPFTECYIDDLVIHGKTKQECIKRTESVLEKLNSFNVKVNISKCEFFKDSIKILGHIKDPSGIHPIAEKCTDICNTPMPTNVTELKSYLGLLGYYQHFIPNLATELKPLYQLLEKKAKWKFDEHCIKTFERSKKLLKLHNVLIHYDMSKPIVLQCDASNYGVGAVLCHEMTPGLLQPIFFASKTLSKAEQNYAQVHKEALAIIFGIKRFNKYLQGQKFTIETDSKPLLTLLGNDKPVPTMANSRMQRWALILANYDYIIKYKKGSDLLLADAMSRLPSKDNTPVDEFSYFICYFSEFENISNGEIQNSSATDSAISKVINYTRFGWPSFSTIPDELKEFYKIKDELSVENNCLLRANRLVIPKILQCKIMDLLHDEHPGIVRMKNLARSYFWFPGMDKAIESYVNKCIPCQITRPNATKVPSKFWPLAGKPFERIHIDYAEFEKHNMLIVKDTYSKWIEVFVVNNTNTATTITKLRSLFACFGLPSVIVSDNAAQFKSDEFVKFIKSNGIIFENSPPYHPNSNGAAERSVDIIKNMLLKQKFSHKAYQNFQHRVDCALFAYRNTPTSVTKLTPSELIFKYVPQTKITKLRSDHIIKEKRYQHYQITHRNKHTFARNFQQGEKVWVRSVRNDEVKWFIGYIKKVISANTYLVKVNLQTRYVHADHLRKCSYNLQEGCEDVPKLMNVPIPVNMRLTTPMTPVNESQGVSVSAQSEKSVLSEKEDNMVTKSSTEKTSKNSAQSEKSVLSEKEDNMATKSSTEKTSKNSNNSKMTIVRSPRPKRIRKPPDRLNL